MSATTAGTGFDRRLLLPMFLTAIVVSSTTGRHPEVRRKLLVGGATQVLACTLLLLLHPASAIWLLLAIVIVVGVPQGLIGLANQNAVYHQSDAARIGSAAGLLRTFMYLGAMVASAATGAFLGDGADTVGLHRLAEFMVVVSILGLAVAVADRSLRRIGRRTPAAEPADTGDRANTGDRVDTNDHGNSVERTDAPMRSGGG
ncbi:MFS transporter [Hamadaea tsunoensis]|uniref:hypothetical protein n=1 Tax=Hamadaea tsunoensis TaxID=53368 RepID=UPI000419515E|nr:hypothetical protein [Hamadaea tsunoensis]